MCSWTTREQENCSADNSKEICDPSGLLNFFVDKYVCGSPINLQECFRFVPSIS